jgi:hypothetical protein
MDDCNARPSNSVGYSRGKTRDLQGVVWILQARGTHQGELLIILANQPRQPRADGVNQSMNPVPVGVHRCPIEMRFQNGGVSRRRFVKGDAGLVGAIAARVAGSADLYQASGRFPINSVNFVTCHDGFTLNDVVSYNVKHNWANGENNDDGVNANDSWNCGVEGETDDPEVEAL